MGYNSEAQSLKRKGGLGVGFYQNIPDSLSKKLQYNKGAVIQSVIPKTTAASLGILKNDVIIAINENPVETYVQLVALAKQLRENDPIQVQLIRNQQPVLLKGTVIAKPRETSEIADVVYGEFPYKNGYVRTIYSSLKNKKPLGTIYFLQGLPCYSMDNFQPLDKTKQALDAIVERGFAVYRIEKGDMGDNLNQAPCETMGFNAELDMYEAGYKNLLSISGIDTASIFLFGHSMGGVTAPLLAEKFQPKGVVVYGTVFKPWLEYLMDAYILQPQLYGEDLAVLRDTLEMFKPFIYDYFYSNKSIDEVCSTPQGKAAMELIMSYDSKTKTGVSGRAASVHKELNAHNLAAAWGNTRSYVLAIYGECDIAAIHPDDHIALVEYINKKHPGKAQFWLAPGTTHTFEEIGTMEDFIKWQYKMNEYLSYAVKKFNPKVFDYTCNWMKSVVSKKL